jgi:hypothetical protein
MIDMALSDFKTKRLTLCNVLRISGTLHTIELIVI